MAFALRRVAVCLALCLSLLLSATEGFAVPHVRGYTKKDGTYVRPHYRSAPGTGPRRSYAPRHNSPSRRVNVPSTSVAPRAYHPPKSKAAPLPGPLSQPRSGIAGGPRAVAPARVGGKVYVKGYTRKDGTYVPPHTRNVAGAGSSSRTVSTAPKKTWEVLHLDTRTDLSRWAASNPVRRQAVRLPTFRYDASTSNQKAREYLDRSAAARRRFLRQTGYPNGRPGYIVDHIIPLACGGPDEPSNMQWQTVAEAKAKDRIERRACS